MHMTRMLTKCLLLFILMDLLLLADSSQQKRGARPNRNNSSAVDGSAPVAAGHKNNRVRQVTFGMISREEWLAKEYFGYLCGK